MIYSLSPEQRTKLFNMHIRTYSPTELDYILTIKYNIEYVEDNDVFGKHYMGSLIGDEKDINWLLLQL